MFSIGSRLSFTRTSGSTVMLWILLLLSVPAATYAVEIVIDNKDSGASWSNVPGWSGQSTTSAYKGQTLRTFNKSAWSTFKFGSLASGKYDVYMHWPNWSGTLPDNAAPVIIKHSIGTQTVTVNQQQNGGQWNRLGSWTLDNTVYLTLTNRGNGPIYSDAVKLVPSSGTPPQDPTLSLTANPVEVGKGGAATLSWASQHTTSCTASGGWSGSKGTSGGSETVNNITSNQTYNLTCAGTTKNVSATVKVAVISTPLPPPPPPLGKPVVGLSPSQHSGTFDAAGQAFTLELGAHSIRVGYNHGDHNFGVNWAAQRGIGVLFFLGYGVGCNPTTASGRQCYADRSASLARTYGNKVQYYEVWNEWNGGFGLGRWPACKPTCDDTAMYTDLLCRTYKAIKAVQPSAKVVGGGLSYTDTRFITGMLNAGAANCMDVLSFHPYVHGDVGANRGGTCPAGTDPVNKASCFLSKITNVDNLVKSKNGGRSIPLAITEEGWNSGGNSSSEQAAATYLTEIYTRGKNYPVLEGIWWYQLEDVPAPQDAPGFGLLRINNTKKPSFAAFQAAANK